METCFTAGKFEVKLVGQTRRFEPKYSTLFINPTLKIQDFFPGASEKLNIHRFKKVTAIFGCFHWK